MSDAAIVIGAFLAGFFFRGQLVGLKFKPKPVKVQEKKLPPQKILKTNPSTPINQ